MVTFLFWNLNKKPIQKLVAALAHHHRVDVLILAECDIKYVDVVESLNIDQPVKYSFAFSESTRIQIFTLLPYNYITPILDYGGVSIRRLKPPIGQDIILVAVHLSSKRYQDTNEQALYSTRLPKLIEQEERKAGHKRTIVVGDFNMNPFENGVVGADALHAVMDKNIALRKSRKVKGEERFFLYNPMWGRFGDTSPGPPGTYYYWSSKQINYFWNMFDQVLLRPDLLNMFPEADPEILTIAGDTPLLNRQGVPNINVASDHLPILFRLNL